MASWNGAALSAQDGWLFPLLFLGCCGPGGQRRVHPPISHPHGGSPARRPCPLVSPFIRYSQIRTVETNAAAGCYSVAGGAPGPISRAVQLAPALVRTSGRFSATVLWVRDPVSRLISTWNFEESLHGKKGAPSRLPQRFAWAERSAHPGSPAAQTASRREFERALEGNGNAGGSLAAYVDDIRVLDAMPPLFVGRTEHVRCAVSCPCLLARAHAQKGFVVPGTASFWGYEV